jgi:hypothetical protein
MIDDSMTWRTGNLVGKPSRRAWVRVLEHIHLMQRHQTATQRLLEVRPHSGPLELRVRQILCLEQAAMLS